MDLGCGSSRSRQLPQPDLFSKKWFYKHFAPNGARKRSSPILSIIFESLLFSPQVAPTAQKNLQCLPRASDGPCRSGLRRAGHYWVKTIASCRRWPRSPIRRISLQTNCVMGIHASLQSSRMAQRGRRSLLLESFRRARAERLVGRSRSKRAPIHNLPNVTRHSHRRIIWCTSLSFDRSPGAARHVGKHSCSSEFRL
jgi:hypothetical protein